MELAVNYSYCVLKYVHDPVAGEALNVGVFVFDAHAQRVSWRTDRHTKRFYNAFANFDRRQHRWALTRFDDLVKRLESEFESGQGSLFSDSEKALSAFALAQGLWPDRGTQYTVGRGGVGGAKIEPGETESDVLERVADSLFDRYVLRQRPSAGSGESRSDGEVWNEFKKKLEHEELWRALTPETVDAGGFAYKFEWTHQNGKLNIVQPLSFDLHDAESIRDKASKWFGYCHQLGTTGRVGEMVLVLGAPKVRSNEGAYKNALKMIGDTPIKPNLVMESEVKSYADRVGAWLRAK